MFELLRNASAIQEIESRYFYSYPTLQKTIFFENLFPPAERFVGRETYGTRTGFYKAYLQAKKKNFCPNLVTFERERGCMQFPWQIDFK